MNYNLYYSAHDSLYDCKSDPLQNVFNYSQMSWDCHSQSLFA